MTFIFKPRVVIVAITKLFSLVLHAQLGSEFKVNFFCSSVSFFASGWCYGASADYLQKRFAEAHEHVNFL